MQYLVSHDRPRLLTLPARGWRALPLAATYPLSQGWTNGTAVPPEVADRSDVALVLKLTDVKLQGKHNLDNLRSALDSACRSD